MTSYLIKTGNAEDFFKAIRNAKAPERFTNTFLKDLGFTSSNDRLYIGVLKGLRFLDDNGAPTDRYFAFLDQSHSDVVLAEAIREAYDDLFAINRDAQTLELEDVQGKLKTLTRGQKSDNVITWMANTFRALCDLAEWSQIAKPPAEAAPSAPLVSEATLPAAAPSSSETSRAPLELHYNIQLILPDTRDQSVFDALFASLRRHLL